MTRARRARARWRWWLAGPVIAGTAAAAVLLPSLVPSLTPSRSPVAYPATAGGPTAAADPAAGAGPGRTDVPTGPVTSFGGPGAPATLVLYDTTGDHGWIGELYAQAAGNLASHFGPVSVIPAADYRAGQLGRFRALIYLGTTYDAPLPRALLDDVRTSQVPVIWSGLNAWKLSGATGSATHAAFVARYGWDPTGSRLDLRDAVTAVDYKGRTLSRSPLDRAGILAPRLVSPSTVHVLAAARCTRSRRVVPCTGASARLPDGSLPWAIRSGNLTYVGENPFSFVGEDDRYLAYADLLFAALAPDARPSRKAAVRLEDVSPVSDPVVLRQFADYLAAHHIPFQVGVVPMHLDPTGAQNDGTPQTVTFRDRPEMVEALRYLQSHGGVLVQHGFTHQYAAIANPYDGVSGEDFEFYRARCSANPDPPYQFQACQASSWVRLVAPLPEDSSSWAADRVLRGREALARAGLDLPTIFETPHYTASAAAYRGMRQVYATRYERELLFGGTLRAGGDPAHSIGQYFPYRVHDVYGGTVLPENLGNIEPLPYNQHPARTPADLIHNAAANLVVTQSVASFFFHPQYPLADLAATIDGIQHLGYTFVPADQL